MAEGIPSCWDMRDHLSKSTFLSPLGGLGILNTSFPQNIFTSEEVILNIVENYLSFWKIQMLLYWLVCSAVSLLCQSLLTQNFPTRQTDWKES